MSSWRSDTSLKYSAVQISLSTVQKGLGTEGLVIIYAPKLNMLHMKGVASTGGLGLKEATGKVFQIQCR